jgi:hypothetical protein
MTFEQNRGRNNQEGIFGRERNENKAIVASSNKRKRERKTFPLL